MDWIEEFLTLTDGLCSPHQFRLWSAISAVAGAMERRLFVRTSLGVEFANMYILLVGPPASGKTEAIRPIREIWHLTNNLAVAPQNATKAALVDVMIAAHRNYVFPGGKEALDYHSVQFPNSELGNVIFSHDLELLSFLNDIFDNDKTYRERKRYLNGGKEIQITNPQLNILFGTQPKFLSSIFPEEAWGMGTMSRFIMIFGDKAPKPELFGSINDRSAHYRELARWMSEWTEMHGVFKFTDAARDCALKYYESLTPIPDHPRLETYLGRRFRYLVRLSMVSALARTNTLVIDDFDVERSRHWLLNAEAQMPSIFREMNSKTDANLIEELHMAAWKMWREGNKVPIPSAWFYQFLSERVFAERIPKVLETAVRSKLFEDRGAGLYVPLPRLDLGGNVLQT